MAPQPPPARSRPPRIDRTKVSPSLLRVFVRTGSHHPDSDYTVDRLPSSEIALYCYPDSSLREVALLAHDALAPIPQPHRHSARISLRLVYYDPDTDRFRSTDLANFALHDLASSPPPSSSSSASSSAAHPAPTARLDRTLAEAKYVVGDLVDLALLVPQADPLAAPGAAPPSIGAGPRASGPMFGIRGAAAAGHRGGAHGAAPGGRGNFAPLAAAGGFGPGVGAGAGAGAGAGPGAGYGPRGGPGGAGGAPVHPSRAGLLGGGAGGPRRGGAPGAADQGWGAQGGRRRSDGPPGSGGFGGAPRGAAGPYGGAGGARGPGGYDARDGPRDRPPHQPSSSTTHGPPPPRRRSSRSRSPGARRASPPPPRRRPLDDDVRMRD